VNEPAEDAGSPVSRALRMPLAFAGKLARVCVDAAQRYFADNCTQHAAGIAYRVLFSIAPLAIVLVSVFGLVLQNDGLREDVVDRIVDALPVSAEGTNDVESAITAIATPASALGLLSLLVFAWAATGMMAAIRRGLEAAMGVVESRPMARAKLVDLVLLIGTAALVLLTAGLTLMGDLLEKALAPLAEKIGLEADMLAGMFLHGESFVLSILVVMLLYRFVPSRGLSFRAGVVGAVVTALLLQAISFASGQIYGRTTQLSVVYGSLAAALVFLYAIYLYASALLLGAEIAAAWLRPPIVDTTPIGAQVKRFGLGLFVKQPPPAENNRDDERSS
jgi:membrane protein